MSSRRKQYKPKSFGVNEEEEGGGGGSGPAQVEAVSTTAPKPTEPNQHESGLNQPVVETATEDVVQNGHHDEVAEEDEPSRKRKRNDSDSEPANANPQPGGDYYDADVIDEDADEDDCEEEEEDEEAGDEEDDLDDTNLDYTIGYADEQVHESRSFNLAPNRVANTNNNNRNRSSLGAQGGYSNSPTDMSDLNSTAANLLLVFKCKVCGKGFKHRRSLNRHVKLHSGEKNFKCPFCTTAFARSDHLKAHIRTHNNSKPYRCSVCQCGYSTQAALKVHIAHHHSKSKFKCVLCNNLEFHSQLALEGHIYTKHSMEKNDIDELLNETATMNPTLVSMDDSNNYNLINQRSRLIEINNYTNLNNKNGDAPGGGASASPSMNGANGNGANNGTPNGSQYYDERDMSENGENLKTSSSSSQHYMTTTNNNACNSNSDGDDEAAATTVDDDDDDDDVIIEQELRPSARLGTNMSTMGNRVSQQQAPAHHQSMQMNGYKKIVPKVGHSLPDNMPPYVAKTPTTTTTTTMVKQTGYPTPCQVRPAPSMNINVPSTGANTYCELCNARFSNVESYAAHMRNCHPSVPTTTVVTAAAASAAPPTSLPQAPRYDSAPKMPYLTSILSTPSSNVLPGQPSSVKYMNKPTPGIIIPLTTATGTNPATASRPSSVCQVPNCNCRYTSVGHSDEYQDDYYVHKETNFTCVQCNLSLLKQADFMQHIKQVHCVEVYRCILCKQMQLFDNLALLKDHFFLVHQSHKYDSYRCKLCPSLHSFHTLDDLSVHVKSVHNQQMSRTAGQMGPTRYPNGYPQAPPAPLPAASFKCYKCTQCDSEFTQQNALNQHVQMVHGQQPAANNSLSCQYCRNTFTNKSQLERHLRIHLTAVDLKCNICDRVFDNQELLIEHKLTHCKTFESSTTAATSTGGNSTGQASSQSTTAANGTSTAVCVYCKQLIENEQQFKEHFKRHNNIGLNAPSSANGRANSFICIVCRQTLTSNSEYYLHLRHHLRRNQPQPQPQPQSQPLKPSSSCPTLGQEPASKEVCSKFLLKCQKCPVKFEYGQDYVAHLKKFHPNEHGDTPSCGGTPLSPALSTASQKTNNSSTSSSSTSCSSSRNGQHVAGSINVKVTAPTAASALKEESRSPLSSASSSSISTTTISSSSSSAKQPTSNSSAGNFLCEICSCKYDSNTKLQTHLLIKHEFQPPNNASGAFVCPVCDETFVRADLLLFHTTIHGQAAKIYKCTKCPQAYVFKSQLINHSFAHQQQQQQHQSNGTKPTPQPAYNLRNRSNDGSADSSPAKRTPTATPQITVVRPSRLLNQPSPRTLASNNAAMMANSQHNWAESQFKPSSDVSSGGVGGQQTYTCTTCSKTFATQRNLSVHIRIHTGFRPFECDVCKRKFTRRENLRSHMKCHLNVRPFSCSICNRSFRRKSHVTSHIEVHFKSKLHNCIECSRQFDMLDAFLMHLINDHSVYDKELLTLIKQKQILDTNKLNIDVDTTINELSLVASRNRRLQMAAAQQAFNRSHVAAATAANAGSESPLTIQSLIDQTSNNDDDYDEDYYNNDEADYQDELDANVNSQEPVGYDDDDLPDEEEDDDFVDDTEIITDNDDLIHPQQQQPQLDANDIDNYLTSIDDDEHGRAPLADDDNDDEIDYTD